MAQLERDDGAQGTVEREPDSAGLPVIKLTGEIDISNAEALGATLSHLIDPGTTRLVVDLAALGFMDSAGIAMLLRATAGIESIEIRNPSELVRRIIECTGLTDVFRLDT